MSIMLCLSSKVSDMVRLLVFVIVVVLGVQAQTTSEGDLRLTACRLYDLTCRLEIYHSGQWGTVCDDGFDLLDAGVACKQLGCSGASSVEGTYGSYASSNGFGYTSSVPIWLENVGCVGTETSLATCASNGWGSICSHYEDVGVSCTDVTVTSENGPGSCLDCPAGNYRNADTKACTPCPTGTYKNTTGPENCTMCPEGYYSNSDGTSCTSLACEPWEADYFQDGSVECRVSKEADLRLVDCVLSSQCCRLEIFHDAQWGTICENNFDSVDASIACKQLACSDGNVSSLVPIGSDPIWLDELNCTGSETLLGSCASSGWGNHDCQHITDVGVCCTNVIIEEDGGIGYCLNCQSAFYKDTSTGNCTSCSMGTYKNTIGTGICLSCAEGTYTSATGQTVCANCTGTGTSSNSENTGCECVSGFYNNATGSVLCEACNPGFYSEASGNTVCEACDVGKYNDAEAQSSCVFCAEGTYTNVTAQTVCLNCTGSGTVSNAENTACECGAGFYNNATGSVLCVACDAGFYSDAPGSSVCEACDVGTYNNVVQQTTCAPCDSGTYSDNLGAVNCTLCAAGTFNNATAQTACVSCGDKTYAGAMGSTACTACASGTYSTAANRTVCLPCPAQCRANATASFL